MKATTKTTKTIMVELNEEEVNMISGYVNWVRGLFTGPYERVMTDLQTTMAGALRESTQSATQCCSISTFMVDHIHRYRCDLLDGHNGPHCCDYGRWT